MLIYLYLYLFNKKNCVLIFCAYCRIFYQLKLNNTMLNIINNFPSNNDSYTVCYKYISMWKYRFHNPMHFMSWYKSIINSPMSI